jgi:hypothetical protein
MSLIAYWVSMKKPAASSDIKEISQSKFERLES